MVNFHDPLVLELDSCVYTLFGVVLYLKKPTGPMS